ncbi:ATP-binding protein [Denitratimonas sp. CY0512]|uniref:sensor histidine kinase n=1 Tax=Denitratimonas sp. CY0512 TaxID=3131940 RepID=UPI00309ADA9A
MRSLRALPLAVWMLALMLLGIVLAAAGVVLFSHWLPPWLAALLSVAVTGVVMALLVWRALVPLRALFRALAGTVAGYRDGDFSFGIRWDGHADVRELVDAHNALGQALREQRVNLVQRELLLDTVVQNTPVAMLLLDPLQHVVLGNLAARRLFGEGRKLEGRHFDKLLTQLPDTMRDALARGGDSMFSAGEEQDIFQLTRRVFRLNGRPHELLLLRQVTAELRRQEVRTWKKVIRVISHELNNSLAPIASLAHSGRELLKRGKLEKLPLALDTIEERARHLERFLRDYAHFAKLPAPRIEEVDLRSFIERLGTQVEFVLHGPLPQRRVLFDPAQIEQALLNLLKNAHEAGGDPAQVRLGWQLHARGWRIEVSDRGAGMNPAALEHALLPFYSTKRSGTGLGLALAREIAEAHGGHLGLANREDGGLRVWLVLAADAPAMS